MPKFFFHIADDLDDDGTVLPNVTEAQHQALEIIGGVLSNGPGDGLWAGKPVNLWVTDAPSGAGKILFEISVFASRTNRRWLTRQEYPTEAPPHCENSGKPPEGLVRRMANADKR
jgi:hypothetical protein